MTYLEALKRSIRDTKEKRTLALMGGWTFEQFDRFVKTGEQPKDREIFKEKINDATR